MPYPTGFISRGRGMNGLIRSSSLPLPAHRPPAEEPQQSAQEPSAKRRCWSAPRCPSEYAGGTANSTLPNGRAKAPCLHEGYLTLPCGRIDLEHLNGPEVTDCGFEQHSTWLFVYESSTRSFPNLPTVPVAHHKRIFQRFCSALLHSRSRMQYLHVANISVG